jgi:hypothetical protein
MESPETLKSAEHEALSKLESSYNDFSNQFQAFWNEHTERLNQITGLARDMALFGTVSPAQVTAANENNLRILQSRCEVGAQWQTYFLSFEPTARTLGQAGLPQLAIRLGEIETDLAGVMNTLQDMCTSVQQHMRANAATLSNAVQYATNVTQQVINTQRQVFDTFRARWTSETFNQCPICHSLLQSRSLPYCWHCKALVVRF